MPNAGRPSGSEPSTATPALAERSNTLTTRVAPITAINTPGSRLLPLSSRIVASVATPRRNAVQFVRPVHTASPIAQRLRNGPSASTEKPNSLGSWLISTVSAMPFM